MDLEGQLILILIDSLMDNSRMEQHMDTQEAFIRMVTIIIENGKMAIKLDTGNDTLEI